jgi:anti-sigma factor NepR-like protein
MQKQEKSKAEERIDENLRLAFQQKMDEDVPERFAELLEQLKKKKPSSHE